MIRLGRGGRPLRIAYGRIFHEANAFSPLTTERDAFENLHHRVGADLARSASALGSEIAGYMPAAELSGFIAAAKVAGGVETVPLSSSLAIPSGSLSGECFDWLLRTLLGELERAGSLDGVYLALHGSMQVEGLEEAPESVILREVRATLGPDAQIAVSYDLHANLSPGLIDPVDIMVAYRTNPHWDLAPTGFRAGNRLIRSLRGEVRPTHAWRKLPMTLGGGTTIHFLSPMRGVFRYMRRLERDPAVLSASLFMVHPYTSAHDHGWAVHVCTDGDPEKAERLAEALADQVWNVRRVPLPRFRDVGEALDEVAAKPRRRAPITLVDADDIVGAGAPGGNTHIIEELVRDDRGLKVLVPVHDPGAVSTLFDETIGNTVSLVLRGTPGYDMPEVSLDAKVAARTTGTSGRTVRLDVGSFHIAVCEGPPLPIHPRFWRELGLEPRRADAIVQKNFFHYRIFYATTSFSHVPVVSSGATSLDRVRQREYAVPTFPRTDVEDWRRYDPVLRGISAPKAAAAEPGPDSGRRADGGPRA